MTRSSIANKTKQGWIKEGFVVLDHQSYTAQEATWSLLLPKTLKHTAPHYALALWVCCPDELAPIQATGTWLPKDLFSLSDSDSSQ